MVSVMPATQWDLFGILIRPPSMVASCIASRNLYLNFAKSQSGSEISNFEFRTFVDRYMDTSLMVSLD